MTEKSRKLNYKCFESTVFKPIPNPYNWNWNMKRFSPSLGVLVGKRAPSKIVWYFMWMKNSKEIAIQSMWRSSKILYSPFASSWHNNYYYTGRDPDPVYYEF